MSAYDDILFVHGRRSATGGLRLPLGRISLAISLVVPRLDKNLLVDANDAKGQIVTRNLCDTGH